MISAKIIENIFKAASIVRFNDYPRPVNLVELDKQAHKAIVAYFLAKCENDVDLAYIVDGIVIEFLARTVITDIRPDVLHFIQRSKKSELNEWVIHNLKDELLKIDRSFYDKFYSYYMDDEEAKKYKKERHIIKAAGFLSTKTEFDMIYKASSFIDDIDEVKAKIDEEVEDFYDLLGVQKIMLGKKLSKIIDLSSRLRFQSRWTQTPRIPETSVLGHMLIVALLSYFYSIKVGAGKNRLINNFFCALFHDLPEALTRDIISPIKHKIGGLSDIIAEYELKLIDEKIMPNIPKDIQNEFSYLLGIRYDETSHKIIKNEFENRIFIDDKISIFSGDMDQVNDDKYNAIDGSVLKNCDRIGAYLEALISIYYGVSSKELKGGRDNVKEYFKAHPIINGVNFYELILEFENYFKYEN